MIDLVCLVADKNMEAVIQAILVRPEALGIRPISSEVLVHPRRDPGCFHEAPDFLRGFATTASHALVLLDRAWQGAPANTGEELERMLGAPLALVRNPGWAEAIVLDPELEVWVFAGSSHVDEALGWRDHTPSLREELRDQGLWPEGSMKPPDPKAAVEHALRAVRRPRSSSIYRQLASRVGFRRCQDRAFLRLRSLLAGWFPEQE